MFCTGNVMELSHSCYCGAWYGMRSTMEVWRSDIHGTHVKSSPLREQLVGCKTWYDRNTTRLIIVTDETFNYGCSAQWMGPYLVYRMQCACQGTETPNVATSGWNVHCKAPIAEWSKTNPSLRNRPLRRGYLSRFGDACCIEHYRLSFKFSPKIVRATQNNVATLWNNSARGKKGKVPFRHHSNPTKWTLHSTSYCTCLEQPGKKWLKRPFYCEMWDWLIRAWSGEWARHSATCVSFSVLWRCILYWAWT